MCSLSVNVSYSLITYQERFLHEYRGLQLSQENVLVRIPKSHNLLEYSRFGAAPKAAEIVGSICSIVGLAFAIHVYIKSKNEKK